MYGFEEVIVIFIDFDTSFKMFIFGIFILIMITYYVFDAIKKRNYPPSPLLKLPILGHLTYFDPKKPYQTLYELSKKYGKIYGLQLGAIYTVVISDVNLIREALKRDEFNGRAPLYVTHGIMGGHGIICAEGPLWKDQRKLATEWLRKMGMVKFGPNRIKMEERILEGVKECIKDINTDLQNDPVVDVFRIMIHTFGNIINEFVFGIKYDRDDGVWNYLQYLQEEGVKYIGICGAVNFLPILRFLPKNKRIINFLLSGKRKTHSIYDKIIENCRRNPSEKEFILKMFLEEKQKRVSENDPAVEFCTDIQLRHLLADIFGASLDTTLTTLRWILLLIGKYPDIQERVFQELQETGKSQIDLSDFDDGRLSYTKAVVSETQRFRSVVPTGIPHGTSRDTELCSYKIPKGAMIIPLQWAVHMNERDWDDPETFNPDRFIGEDGYYQASPFFIPFQTGKRVCLGEELARMMLYLHMANIILNFKIELVGADDFDLTGDCGITLSPKEHKLTFQKRP